MIDSGVNYDYLKRIVPVLEEADESGSRLFDRGQQFRKKVEIGNWKWRNHYGI